VLAAIRGSESTLAHADAVLGPRRLRGEPPGAVPVAEARRMASSIESYDVLALMGLRAGSTPTCNGASVGALPDGEGGVCTEAAQHGSHNGSTAVLLLAAAAARRPS
jgi:hypothetical protein